MGVGRRVIIVGGGIAGASVAYWLARLGVTSVLLCEREGDVAYHSTGRSAAVFYAPFFDAPSSATQQLKLEAGRFYRALPVEFSEAPILDRTGTLMVYEQSFGRIRQLAPSVKALGIDFELLAPRDISSRWPLLDGTGISGGVHCSGGGRLDVHELITSYLRHAKSAGCDVRLGAEVTEVLVQGGRCVGVRLGGERVHADWVVNAAGAWAGTLAELACATAVPLEPRRRSAIVYDAPDLEISHYPFVCFQDRRLYFEPESGGVLMSPMDETPVPPSDVHADDVAIAEGVERLREVAQALVPRSVKRRWAGLRTFAPDEEPVIGEDPRLPGFFWLAGQGGQGIVTSPALGRIAAELLTGGEPPAYAQALLVSRFAGVRA